MKYANFDGELTTRRANARLSTYLINGTLQYYNNASLIHIIHIYFLWFSFLYAFIVKSNSRALRNRSFFFINIYYYVLSHNFDINYSTVNIYY